MYPIIEFSSRQAQEPRVVTCHYRRFPMSTTYDRMFVTVYFRRFFLFFLYIYIYTLVLFRMKNLQIAINIYR
jgi:uncharacterized protein YybS (DUF2232 family)